jgi:hypothetical protein
LENTLRGSAARRIANQSITSNSKSYHKN